MKIELDLNEAEYAALIEALKAAIDDAHDMGDDEARATGQSTEAVYVSVLNKIER